MHILPVPTKILTEGDNLASILLENTSFEDGDIVVVSSKALATIAGDAIDLKIIEAGPKAKEIYQQLQKHSPLFYQAVINETERMNGFIVGKPSVTCLTELHPDGIHEVSMLACNAGLDMSNIDEGYLIGWPQKPVQMAKELKNALEQATHSSIGVIVSDSCSQPRRIGVVAIALTVCGLEPIVDERSSKDLFDRPLEITREARADQLATAANVVMGNANQATPAAIVRNSGVELSDFCGWVPGIAKEEDLFQY